MIAHLRGTLLDKQPGSVVVEAAGVGYELAIPLSTYTVIGEPGETVALHVHTHVREDALALFGFGTRLEKDLFQRLIAVSGVGPKTAVALLSGLGAEALIAAVRARDVRRLSSVPGIGRKTAERIALEIADRIEALSRGAALPARGPARMQDDLVSALLNLGYNARAAEDAAAAAMDEKETSPPAGFEALFRRALRSLAR
jgi:Holliday junction DNA helicase RuvA